MLECRGWLPGQQVVVDQAPALGSVGGDDGVVVFVHQTGPCLGFAEFAVRGTLGFDHVGGHAESDGTVDGPAVVGVLDGDLVAEEFRRACSGVGDQRFLLRQFQSSLFLTGIGTSKVHRNPRSVESVSPQRLDLPPVPRSWSRSSASAVNRAVTVAALSAAE